MTLRAVTHRAQWNEHSLVTECDKNAGTFWCCNENTTIFVDYDTPIDCMTCLVSEARGG